MPIQSADTMFTIAQKSSLQYRPDTMLPPLQQILHTKVEKTVHSPHHTELPALLWVEGTTDVVLEPAT